MTRLWRAGQPIVVVADEQGHPLHFSWRGQIHRVQEITRQWRVDRDWWRERRWRACYKLSTDTGLLVILYQDLVSDAWFLQRLYD